MHKRKNKKDYVTIQPEGRTSMLTMLRHFTFYILHFTFFNISILQNVKVNEILLLAHIFHTPIFISLNLDTLIRYFNRNLVSFVLSYLESM